MRRLILTSRWLALSLLITAILAMPLSLVLVPKARRAYRLGGLSSGDPRRQEAALLYVARRAARDPAVLTRAVVALQVADDRMFMRIAAALIRAGRWRLVDVPMVAMLRRASLLAVDADPEARILACHALADLPGIAQDQATLQRAAEVLGQLGDDPAADVRYNALVAAAELAGVTRPGALFRPIIAARVNDDSAEIARQAWLFLGVLRWTEGVPPDKRTAVLLSSPQDSPPKTTSTAPAEDPASTLAVLDAWAWACLGKVTSRSATQPGMDESVSATAPAPLPAFPQAAIAATGPATRPGWWSDDDPDATLAILEAHAGRDLPLVIPERVPHLLRLAAVAAMKDPRPEDLREVFTSEAPELRDLACVLAAERFTPEQNADLVRWCLLNYHDDAKRAGAILSGLTGQRADLLAQRLAVEDVWSVQVVMKLGLWMQGKLNGIDPMIPGLFVRPDVARSTLLLALLHRRDPQGLDYLLNPRGEPRFDVLSQLDQRRWWGVLRRYLPADAPPFWVHADRDLQSFQLDVLRNWYTVNRRTLYPR